MVGVTLLLSEFRWFQRVPIATRLYPYTSGGRLGKGDGLLSVGSFSEVIAPLSRVVGEQLARLFRVGEELGARLERIHSEMTVTGFRVRQVGWVAAAIGASILTGLALDLAALQAAALVIVAPLGTFWFLEHQIATASRSTQRRIAAELPIVAEQIGLLLTAGWSLSGALARLSQRSGGTCARDMVLVTGRIRQGLSEVDALREWARRADVDSLHRLVGVLALNREATDLGGLIGEEARAMRQQAHREVIEAIEKRNQTVWIPVTAATLVPGVMLMGVPFVDALSVFAG